MKKLFLCVALLTLAIAPMALAKGDAMSLVPNDAVSVGVVEGRALLDLDYSEDSHADVDFNVVGTDAGAYVELQGTAEGVPFDRAATTGLLDLADSGLARLFDAQAAILATVRR